MKRTYNSNNTVNNATFFTGYEVEKTPAYNQKTLFIVGIQSFSDIVHYMEDNSCTHLFFGANHSFNPTSSDDYLEWETMIRYFLEKDILCSLDIHVSHAADFLEGGLCEWDNFIPQIRVPIPYVSHWNYNTMIKIDDRNFKESNPGVWCHSLHSLLPREKFTSWSEYSNDTVIY